MNWTSVKYKLPTEGVKVLTYNSNYNSYDVAYIKRRAKDLFYWLTKDGSWSIEVTHWMPLPNAPKE